MRKPHGFRGEISNCGAMTALHRTLPFGAVRWSERRPVDPGVTVMIAVSSGAFLDLSPAAAGALGCRCTHRNVTATVVQMGSAGPSSPAEAANAVAAVATPLFFQTTADVMRPSKCSDPQWPWLLPRTTTVAAVVATRTDSLPQRRSIRPLTDLQQFLAVGGPNRGYYRPLTDLSPGPLDTVVDLAAKRNEIDGFRQKARPRRLPWLFRLVSGSP